MHVAIYETVHFENIAPLLRLFDLPGNRITVFCDEEARQQAIAQLKDDADRFEWKLQKSGQSRRAFLTEAKRYVRSNAVDLLYINTISDNFIHLNRKIKGSPMRCFHPFLQPGRIVQRLKEVGYLRNNIVTETTILKSRIGCKE